MPRSSEGMDEWSKRRVDERVGENETVAAAGAGSPRHERVCRHGTVRGKRDGTAGR